MFVGDVFGYVAQQLGLRMTPADRSFLTNLVRLDGVIEGRRVSVVRFIGKSPYVRMSAALEPPLDLGLSVTYVAALDGIRELFGAVDTPIGDADFDALYTIRADDAGRAQAVLGPEVRAAMRAGPIPIELDDEAVTTRFHPDRVLSNGDPASLFAALATLVRVAGIVDAARWRAPPASDVAHLAGPLAAFAHAQGLAFAAGAPLAARGILDRHPVWVVSRRRPKGGFGLEIGVFLVPTLPFYLMVRTAGVTLTERLWASDATIGDPAFDAAFDVDVHPDAVAHIPLVLDAWARAELVAVGAGRSLELSAHALVLRDDAADFDASSVLDALHRLVGIADRVRRGAGATSPQAYR